MHLIFIHKHIYSKAELFNTIDKYAVPLIHARLPNTCGTTVETLISVVKKKHEYV